jgi:membrane-bound ClpP family serine protease
MEVFFTSAGILAFLSFAAVIAAVVMGFNQGSVTGVLILLGAILGMPATVIFSFKYLPKTPMGRRLLLIAPKSEDVLPDDPEKERLKGLLGRTGRAKSPMLLSGVISIDGHTVEAVSESMPIEVGQMVRVVQIEGLRVVVRPIELENPTLPPVDPLKRSYDDPFDLPPA